MSILFTEDRAWLANNWISRGFFEDCLPHLNHAPLLADDIRFCVDAGVDTLDLRGKSRAEIRELQVLLERVIHQHELSEAPRFHSPEAHPLYLARLKELSGDIMQMLETLP